MADDAVVRIPMKPQTGMFALNLVIQPAMAALFGWMALDPTGSNGGRGFGAVFFFIALGLFAFSALAVARTRGKTFEIVLADGVLSIPVPVRARTERVALAAIRKAAVTETPTAAKSFWMLTLEHEEGGAKKSVVVASQFVGDEAFFALREALVARGVHVS
jgi:hypothetical protein